MSVLDEKTRKDIENQLDQISGGISNQNLRQRVDYTLKSTLDAYGVTSLDQCPDNIRRKFAQIYANLDESEKQMIRNDELLKERNKEFRGLYNRYKNLY